MSLIINCHGTSCLLIIQNCVISPSSFWSCNSVLPWSHGKVIEIENFFIISNCSVMIIMSMGVCMGGAFMLKQDISDWNIWMDKNKLPTISFEFYDLTTWIFKVSNLRHLIKRVPFISKYVKWTWTGTVVRFWWIIFIKHLL